MIGIAVANPYKERIGRLHRNSGNHEPQAKRNRQRLVTACGLRLDLAFPFSADDVPAAEKCAKCFPFADTHPTSPSAQCRGEGRGGAVSEGGGL